MDGHSSMHLTPENEISPPASPLGPQDDPQSPRDGTHWRATETPQQGGPVIYSSGSKPPPQPPEDRPGGQEQSWRTGELLLDWPSRTLKRVPAPHPSRLPAPVVR